MKFVVLFEDDDAFSDQRTKLMQAHLAFLDRNSSSIEAAGPLVDTVSNAGAGGLWLVEAGSADAVRRLVEEDPFWPSGLRKSVTILNWRQVYANAARLI